MNAYFVGRADLDVFVRFENTASCINAGRRAGSGQLCLLACVVTQLSRSDRHVLALLLCAGLIALCGAVLCLR